MNAAPTTMRCFPGSKRLLMHPDGGRQARRTRTLAGTSDWRRGLLDRLGGAAVAITGPRWWPQPSTGWSWPHLSPEDVVTELRRSLPGLRLIGAALPRQHQRARLSLLCWFAGNAIVVKLGVEEPGASMRTECAVLTLLKEHPLPGIRTPVVLAFGRLPGDDSPIEFLATTTIGLGAQRPAIDVALRTFEADLALRLEGLDRGDADTASLVPIHGDLTPWNLRQTPRGLALFDWESAGWGAPHSDVADYRRACDEVRPWWRRPPRSS